jgi:hypothetical protein
MKRLPSHDHDRRNTVVRVRFGVGIWLLCLAAYLGYSGSWWGVLFLAPAALHFYLAYRLHHSVQS